jgi:DNA-binding beta-propeller fold protein YncE
MDRSFALALDPPGNVYVADTFNSRVEEFDPAGRLLLAWGTSGTGNGEFSQPEGIATDGQIVYVADTGNQRVQAFDTSGRFLFAWGHYGYHAGEFDVPQGVAVSPGGAIYVVGLALTRLRGYHPRGGYDVPHSQD